MSVASWFHANPRTEWAMIVGGAAIWVGIFDLMRNQGDPDGDTLTEVIRDIMYLDTKQGKAVLITSLTFASTVFYKHLTSPAMIELLKESRMS